MCGCVFVYMLTCVCLFTPVRVHAFFPTRFFLKFHLFTSFNTVCACMRAFVYAFLPFELWECKVADICVWIRAIYWLFVTLHS